MAGSSRPPTPGQVDETDTADPPPYSQATIPGSAAEPTVHRFVRRGLINTRILVLCNDIERFTLIRDKSSEGTFIIHAGASVERPPLGSLTLSTSLSGFNINLIIDPPATIFIKAQAGYPHPKSFSFRVPSSNEDNEWRHRRGWLKNKIDGSQDVPVIYDLMRAPNVRPVASLTVREKSIAGTTISWSVEPSSEWEQALVVLSAVGVAARLGKSLKGSTAETKEFFAFPFGIFGSS